MSTVRATLTLLSSIAALVLLGPPAASYGADEKLRIQGLEVVGGEAAWHPGRAFRLRWNPPAAESLTLIDGISYRIENAAGEVVVPTTYVDNAVTVLDLAKVPPLAGEYTASVWLVGSGGPGPIEQATLRFDDTPPAPVGILDTPAWVKAGSLVPVQIGQPAQPWPPAGIRGYAVAVDRGSGGPPCPLEPGLCSEAETDLRGGADDDWIALGPLAAGEHFVRAVAVSSSGVSSATVVTAAIHVDGGAPAVRFAPDPVGWSDRPVQVRALASDGLSGMAAEAPSVAMTAIAIDAGRPRVAHGASALVTVHGNGLHRVEVLARDAVGNATWEPGAPPPATAWVGIDEVPPQVAFSELGDPAEPERIEATVSDPLSGPAPAGGRIEIRPLGSRGAFLALPTRSFGSRLVAKWDSDSFPPGTYEFRAVALDLAGNRATGTNRAGGEPMRLPNPLKTPTRVELGFGGRRLTTQRCIRSEGRVRCRRRQVRSLDRRPARIGVRFGKPTPLAGRLTSSTGFPIAGVPLVLSEEFAPGLGLGSRLTKIETAPDGSFSARLPAGPNRRLRVRFAGSRLLGRSESRGLRLDVSPAVRLRASARSARIGGAPVVFSGSVSPVDPAGPLPVALQFRLGAGRWSEFRTVAADRHGRFRYAYAFSDDDSRGVRFQFRAVVAARAGWPYATGSSLPVFVTGR